jgi:lactoylglutathione lyase
VKLTHVRLLVRDYAASFAFWRDIVGLDVTVGDEAGPYAEFDTGNATLAIFSSTAMSNDSGITSGRGGRGADDLMICLEVDDVDEAYRRLSERGVHFVGEPTDQLGWGIRVAHFRDPDGNLAEINAQIDDPPAETGPADE